MTGRLPTDRLRGDDAVKRLDADVDVVAVELERIGELVGTSLVLDQPFDCLLPGHEQAPAGATVSRGKDGVVVYRCLHVDTRIPAKDRCPAVWPLAAVFANLVAGFPVAKKFGEPTTALYHLRLLHEVGLVEPIVIDLPGLSPRASERAQRLRLEVARIFGLRAVAYEFGSIPLSRRFCAAWMGLGHRPRPADAIASALTTVKKATVVDAGIFVPERGRPMRLYLPAKIADAHYLPISLPNPPGSDENAPPPDGTNTAFEFDTSGPLNTPAETDIETVDVPSAVKSEPAPITNVRHPPPPTSNKTALPKLEWSIGPDGIALTIEKPDAAQLVANTVVAPTITNEGSPPKYREALERTKKAAAELRKPRLVPAEHVTRSASETAPPAKYREAAERAERAAAELRRPRLVATPPDVEPIVDHGPPPKYREALEQARAAATERVRKPTHEAAAVDNA